MSDGCGVTHGNVSQSYSSVMGCSQRVVSFLLFSVVLLDAYMYDYTRLSHILIHARSFRAQKYVTSSDNLIIELECLRYLRLFQSPFCGHSIWICVQLCIPDKLSYAKSIFSVVQSLKFNKWSCTCQEQ